MKSKRIAIILAAGNGKRMGGSLAKQYLLLGEKPVIWYSLSMMERSPIIDEIVLVVGKGDVERCRSEYVEQYHFTKVSTVIEGGEERFLSVARALEAISEEEAVLFIQDSARPFLTLPLLEELDLAVRQYGTATAAVPAKDTMKIVDAEGFSLETPNRDSLWVVQTPQAFWLSILRRAYQLLLPYQSGVSAQSFQITDDTTIVERMLSHPTKMVMASYRNLKITTPEDLTIAETYLASML